MDIIEVKNNLDNIEKHYGRAARKKIGYYLARGYSFDDAVQEVIR